MKNRKSEKGQISVMIAIMMSTFILFFAFVINTGMLVNAKINLQNAADLAAYAGASVQARQLTQISYLNYEMRRQWKKFLFRIYVIGNMSQDGFPRGGMGGDTGTDPMTYIPNSNESNIEHGVPISCVIFSSTDNPCRLNKLPKIQLPPTSPLDGLNEALRSQLMAIEKIRQAGCSGQALVNKYINYYWLFNTDPDASNSMDGVPPLQENITRILVGLIRGLGIVPREILLRFRIKTLTGYVNSEPQMSVGFDKAKSLLTEVDPAAYERTIQAFYSAYYTLGNHTFPGDQIFLDELIKTPQLVLKDISDTFDTYAIDQKLTGSESDESRDCETVVVPIVVSKGRGLVLGVYKDPSILTHYAVRVRAKARILFSPFGDLDLKAYAAARPFGSRIGPQIASFTAQGQAKGYNASTSAAGNDIAGKYPNLIIRGENDSANRGKGWDTKQALGYMYSLIQADPTAGGSAALLSSSSIENAYHAAMAPNPPEASQYNIINDEGGDSFIKNFDAKGFASFWAPVFPPDQAAGSIKQDIKEAVSNLFNPGSDKDKNIFEELGNSIARLLEEKYINGALTEGKGEDGEGRNIVRISNPFMIPSANGPSRKIIGPSEFVLSDPKLFKSSWNTVTNSRFREEGRVGYSVKFVSFDSLTKNRDTSNGAVIPTNSIGSDTEADGDIPFIKH